MGSCCGSLSGKRTNGTANLFTKRSFIWPNKKNSPGPRSSKGLWASAVKATCTPPSCCGFPRTCPLSSRSLTAKRRSGVFFPGWTRWSANGSSRWRKPALSFTGPTGKTRYEILRRLSPAFLLFPRDEQRTQPGTPLLLGAIERPSGRRQRGLCSSFLVEGTQRKTYARRGRLVPVKAAVRRSDGKADSRRLPRRGAVYAHRGNFQYLQKAG